MKKLIAVVILSALSFASRSLHADTFTADGDTLNLTLKTGSQVDVLHAVGAGEWTYTNSYLSVLHGGVLSLITNTVTITYADALGSLGVLNVNDVCTSVQVLATPAPCQQFALSYTNLSLPDTSVTAAVGLNVNVGAVTTLNFGPDTLNLNALNLSVAGGNASITSSAPPAATPEPATLSLMATGLAGAAGMLRRRFGKQTS